MFRLENADVGEKLRRARVEIRLLSINLYAPAFENDMAALKLDETSILTE